MDKTHQLIDNIYAAALNPSEWPTVLQDLQVLFNANAAGIYKYDTIKEQLTQFELQGVEQNYVNSYIDNYAHKNPWTAVFELQIPGKIRTDQSLDKHHNTPGFYRKTEYFNDWLEPHDFYYSLGTTLLSRNNINTKFYMYRSKFGHSFSKQDITKFQYLSGHMIRSMEMTQRLALKDSQISEALHFIDRLKFGVLFLDDDSTIIHANQFAEKLMHAADGLKSKAGAILATHRSDGKKLSALIQSALQIYNGQSKALPCTLNIQRPSGKRPFDVTAIPLPHQTSPFAVPSAALILFICDPELDPGIPTDYLQHRYGLTATEAKLAQCLSQGDSLRKVAEHAGLSYETARWYLKIIFQKTGARRQAELLRLLLSDQVFITH